MSESLEGRQHLKTHQVSTRFYNPGLKSQELFVDPKLKDFLLIFIINETLYLQDA